MSNKGLPQIDSIRYSNKIAERSFPTRIDYEQFFVHKGYVLTGSDTWESSDNVIAIQQHWHACGQNGCVFAQQIARTSKEGSWQHYVTFDPVLSSKTIGEMEEGIHAAIRNPACEILSLLFPKVLSTSNLVGMLCAIQRIEGIIMVAEVNYGNLTTIALRAPLPPHGALSWLMGFGPFDYLPQTRQSPTTEISIRVKPKPEKQFHRLNPDADAAHLADFPVKMPDHSMEKIWLATLKNTRDVLESEPNHFSSAKVTFTVPHNAWNDRVGQVY